MSNAFAIEENYRETGIRQGNPIGGYYTATVARNTWHRLMPSGNTGAVVADTVDAYKEKLTIGPLRSDITNAPIGGWMLFVLNQGYQEMYQIRTYAAEIIHLARNHRQNTEMALHTLPASGIEFVIFPIPILPFIVNHRGAASSVPLEIGFQPQDKWGTDGIQSLGSVKIGESFRIPTQRLDRLLFRMTGSGTAVAAFSWGEHDIG